MNGNAHGYDNREWLLKSVSRYSPNAIVRCIANNKLSGVRQQAPPADNIRPHNFELSLADVAILELFSFYPGPQEVYSRFIQLDYVNGLEVLYESLCETEPSLRQAEYVQMYIGKKTIQSTGFVRNDCRNTNALRKMNLSNHAAKDPRVAVAVLKNKWKGLAMETSGFADFDSFRERVRTLQEEGFISPDVGALNWGDLRRRQPLCQFFGFLRGTPVPDYYLNRFIESIREDVTGVALEIGGEKKNRDLYGFNNVTEYRILDLPGLSDDIAGNANDADILPEDTFDSVVILNVLEHCEKPQAVVDNIHRWLKPGGRVFVLVPSAQRIHPAPGDYWRPLPQALQSLFKGFRKQRIRTYGNISTVVASFHGIAAEELTLEELEFNHPDYPVVSCLVAVK